MEGREKNMLHGTHSARVKNIRYPLDKHKGAACAYSLRRLRKDYTGPLIRINVSGVTTDIYSKHDVITGMYYVDWNYIDTLYPNQTVSVDRWYDQSGNGFTLTSSSFPLIKDVNSLSFTSYGDNRNPFYNLNGFIGLANIASSRLINASINLSTPITFFTVQSIGTSRATGVVLDSYNSSQCALYNSGTLESPNYRYSMVNGSVIRNNKDISALQMNLTSGVLGGSNSNLGIDNGYGMSFTFWNHHGNYNKNAIQHCQ